MHLHRIFAIAGLAALALAPTAGQCLAATAHASDRISIFAGPSTDEHVIGRLEAGEEVSIDRCTPFGYWCRIFHDGPTGWVPGSYLIGAAAKTDATPGRSITESSDIGHAKLGF